MKNKSEQKQREWVRTSIL